MTRKMNTFYFCEGEIFETLEQLKKEKKKKLFYVEIHSYKDFDEFQDSYENARNKGYSYEMAIEEGNK